MSKLGRQKASTGVCQSKVDKVLNIIALVTIPVMGFILVGLTGYYFITGEHKKRLSIQKFHL